MSISIQGSAAAQLATLESLTNKAAGSTGTGATSLLDATQPQADSSSIINVSGGASQAPGVAAGLATSASIADAAVSAGTAIQGLLARMQQDAAKASDPSTDSGARAALNTNFKANLAQIQQAIAAASMDGVNLLDGSVEGAANVSSATLTGVNLSLGGPQISLDADANLSSPSVASTIASQLEQAIGNVGKAVGQISAQGQAIESHLSVVTRAGLAGSSGVAGALNGSLDADGARLTALQVQQQLSLSGGSIASTTPNAILALFRAS